MTTENTMSMSDVIAQALREYVPDDEGNPFAAWAGECSLFIDAACQIADEHGVQYVIGNAYNGKLEGGFEITPPPGLTMDEVQSFDIIRNLNHIWLIHDGKHFDGSTADGVESIFDLRLVRQVAVELIREHSPERLQDLSASYGYWRESEKLFDDYLAVIEPEHDESASFEM